MRATNILCAALLAICVSPSLGTAYEFTNLGDAGGWKKNPITMVLDRSDFTTDLGADAASLDSVDAALQSAFDTWADVSTTDKLSFERQPDLGGNYDVFDGLSGSLDQGADWRYANIVIGGWLSKSYFDSLAPGGGEGILAVAWTAKLRGGSSPKPEWTSDIFFNDFFTWSTDPGAGEIDIETVAVHEIGHGIGFDHENDVLSVMNSFYDGIQRDLFPDDEAAVAALYGSGGGGGGGGGRGGPSGGGPPGRNKLGIDGFEWTLTGVTYVDDLSFDLVTAPVPEPSTFILAAIGLAGLALRGRRRKNRATRERKCFASVV